MISCLNPHTSNSAEGPSSAEGETLPPNTAPGLVLGIVAVAAAVCCVGEEEESTC